MAATGKVLGTVTSVVGEVKATAADGTVRVLQVGDVVHSDETITTSAAGAVNIALENGKTLDCGANSDLSLHESILGVATAVSNVPGTPGSPAPGSVEALQQAIASGQDPSQIAPATAAGGAPAAGGAGGDGGGGSPVIIEQANSAGPITAGINTAGGSITFPTPEFQLLAGEEEEPEVSVSVQVQVEVQVQVNVDVSVQAGVEVLDGPAEGGVFAVSAGGDAVSLLEGSLPGTNVVPFVITLSQVFDTDVQVTYQILSGTADTPSDYFGVLTATITIPAGENSFTVPVDIVRDHVVEGNETFKIVLVDAVNATINPDKDEAMVTIFNDDAPPVANDDTNWAQEDVAVVVSGNVVQDQAHPGDPSASLSFADAADTDNFETPFVTDPRTEDRPNGTLVLNSDGSYTFTLNNSSAAIQALDSGETLIETYNYTISDGFNAPDSATLTVTIFGSNDVPEITVRTSGDIFASGAQGTVDEAALAPNGSNPDSHAEFVTGSFKVADTDGVDDIQTVTINGQEVAIANLVGAVFHGSAGDMTVTAYADGVASFTYQLLHAVTHDEANQTPPDVFTLIASDGTSDSAPANITINILDDVPSTQVTASQSETTLTVDETVLAANATANFAGDFAGGSSFGADGPGSVSDAIYTLSIGGTNTGLVDSETGNAVTLAMNGGVVEGRVDNGDGFFVVFTVSVDQEGNVTLDQQRSVMHTPDAGADQPTTLISADLIVLNRSATITDADGDTANASASINIGQALVFEDDAPSVNVSTTAAADTLTVDETDLDGDASANFADNFTGTSAFGEDGAGTLTTEFTLSIGAGSTGLVDTATGEAVTLQMGPGGSVQGVISGGVVVFQVSVTAGGQVSLDQQRAVMHTPDSGADQSTGLATANLIVLTRTDTIVDKDGDTATSSANIDVGSAISFKDDAPSVNVTLEDVSTDSLTVDESSLDDDATASYADNFDGTSSFGADGAGTLTTQYLLSVKSAGVASGLTDTETGQSVILTVNGLGEVEGRTAGSNALVFKVSVDASGNVTLDQQRAVMHSPEAGPDQSTTLAASDLIVLTRKDTITDKDGDTAESSQQIEIGQALHFEDDAPTLDITGGDTSVIEGQSITNGTWTSTTGEDTNATTKVVVNGTEYDLGTGIDTGKGTLTVNADNTWTFVAAPNQVNPQNVSFTLKITDKDLDVASDSHTITIDDGANPGASGTETMTVNEAALSDGSNPSSTAETATAGVTFTSGSDAINSIVFGSTDDITVNAGLNEGQTIVWTPSGDGRTLTGSIGGVDVIQVVLTGDSSVAAGGSTGNVTATATLLNNMLHQNDPNAVDLVISGIQIVGTDTDGDVATHVFTAVTVIDDAPALSAQSIQVNHTIAHYSGNYSFADGADDSAPPSAFGPGTLVWTNRPSDINFEQTGENQYTATFVDGGATYFIITVNNDSTYDFNLVTPLADTSEESGELFGALTPTDLDGNGSTEAAVADPSNFGGAFALVMTGSDDDGATYGGTTLINKSATDLGVNGNSIQESQDERVKFDVVQQPGFENATVTELTVEISSTGSISTGDRVDLHVVFTDASDTTVQVSYDNSGTLVFDIPSGKIVDYLELIPITKNVTLKVTGIEVEYETNLTPADDKLDFTLTGHDGDGDTSSANFTVTVNAGTAGNDTLFTGNGNDQVSGGAGNDSISTAGGNDILIGGEGHDTLIGGAGSDTYVFTGSLDASNSDTLQGFTVAVGGDVLNLHDVLPEAAQGKTTEGELGAYINVLSGGGNTTISVDADGAPGGSILVVTLEGVTTTLAQLLNNNQIVT